jgi:hypothetical protein
MKGRAKIRIFLVGQPRCNLLRFQYHLGQNFHTLQGRICCLSMILFVQTINYQPNEFQ